MFDLSSPVHFNPIWPYPIVVLVSLLVLFVVAATYPKTIRHLPSNRRRSLITLRVTAWALLVLAMLRPSLKHEESEEQSRVLLILADDSRSMSVRDAPGNITRREAILQILKDVEDELEALGEKAEIRVYNFSEDLVQTTELENETPGNSTRFDVTLEQLLDETREQKPYLGALLFSDGAQRPLDQNQLTEKVKSLSAQLKPRIFAIKLGGQSINQSSRDLSVEEITDFDPETYEKKVVVLHPEIRIRGAARQKLTVRVLVEDRSGVSIGETGEMVVPPATSNSQPSRLISTNENDETIQVELSFVPPRTGSMKIAVEVVPIEGEVRLENNRKERILTVKKGGLTVAYFDTYRPEQKFLRHVNSAEQFQLDYQPIRLGGLRTPPINPNMFEPDAYDVYIIGDVPATVFGPENLAKLAARIQDGSGLLMIGGANSFGAGGYGTTPLARFLPVLLPAGKTNHTTESLTMVPTRRGLYEYVMRLDTPERNRQAWEALEPMAGANLLERKNNLVQVLAESQENQIPLLFAHEVGPARVMAFAADTTYLWFLGGQEQQHQRFWQQMILWLAHKEEEGDQRIWANVPSQDFNTGGLVPLSFGARSEEGEPLKGANFTIRVRNPEGEITEHQRAGGTEENLLELTEQTLPGDYWVQVTASQDGNPIPSEAWTRFIVEDRDLEMNNPVAEQDLLKYISTASKGKMLPPEDLRDQLISILDELEEKTTENLLPLWDNWIFLLMFVGVMTTEWLLRKRNGMV